jgi:hypothetical protein
MIILFIITIVHNCIAISSMYLCDINQLQHAFIVYSVVIIIIINV